MAEEKKKGKGKGNGIRLTPEQKEEVRALAKKGDMTNKQLSEKFGVTPATIGNTIGKAKKGKKAKKGSDESSYAQAEKAFKEAESVFLKAKAAFIKALEAK